MSASISDLIQYLQGASQGFVGFPKDRCDAAVSDMITMSHENAILKAVPVLDEGSIHPDNDSPGLYLQCASAEQREAIIRLLKGSHTP